MSGKINILMHTSFFQALLSTYLLENIDMLSKHCLVIYILLDLVSVDNTDNAEQVMPQF